MIADCYTLLTMGQSMTYGRCVLMVFGDTSDGAAVSLLNDIVRTVLIRGDGQTRC